MNNSSLSRSIREREARTMLVNAERQLREAREAVERLSAPVSPGRGSYSIDVRFERNGPTYTFLVLIGRTGKIYTTAVADGGTFRNFDEFVAWLRGKEPFTCTDLIRVEPTGEGTELV